MKILLLAILINATNGAPVAVHIEAPYDTFEQCGAAAQAHGVVKVHDNIATEYVCRKTEENGMPTPEVKTAPDGSEFQRWLNKQIERQTESRS